MPRRIAATCAIVCVGLAAGCGLTQGEDSYQMPAESSAASSYIPRANDSVERAGVGQKMPVYWLDNTDSGVYLYREYVQDTRHQEPISDAIAYLLAGKAADPGWYTHLKPSEDIGASIDNSNLITLDLPAKVFSAHLDRGLSERTVQQLVFTATAAAANSGILVGNTPATVRILVDGKPNEVVFGGYELQDVYERDTRFMAPVWVIDPQFGSVVESGSVKITGRTSDFTKGTYYQLNAKGSAAASKSAAAPNKLADKSIESDGSFELTTRLAPGSYELQLWGENKASKEKIGLTTSEFTVK
ncbi:GerMN domain-containing protein [Glutamicibacter uratoxydans]|uniref:GerMN domain-containing protein n=1 Tax=Glutamicibacter uratoxydans TaxID=43667 RepID=UPI00114476F8|nr:GerMN domain-containing protein [Glutamicibacter uratoxydans]